MVKELLSALLHLLDITLKRVFLFQFFHKEVLELGLIVVIRFLLNILLLVEQRQLCDVHLHLLLLSLKNGLLMLLQLVVGQLRVTEVADTELLVTFLCKAPFVV